MLISSANVKVGENVYIVHGYWIQGVGGVTIDDEIMQGPFTVVPSTNHAVGEGAIDSVHREMKRSFLCAEIGPGPVL